MSQRLFQPKRKIYWTESSTVAGKKEGEGPLGQAYDLVFPSLEAGEATREQEEASAVRSAYEVLLKKSGYAANDVDLIFGGDLMNQCTASAFGLKESSVSYIGLYGACSTYVLGALCAAMSMESSFSTRCIFGASSNFATAERQFRAPLEYGGQRSPTAQWTVSGCGMGLLETTARTRIRVKDGLWGQIVDGGIKDVSNMGAAMAPAAADTLLRYFRFTRTSPKDYDAVVTGDLGLEGNRLLCEILKGNGIMDADRIGDCGLMIYHRKEQDVHCGGSGCACSALVHGAHFFPAFQNNTVQNMLLVGTGALMSPMTVQQGLSIPGIAHLIHFQKEED